MIISVTDPDPIIRDKQHAINFTTVYNERQSSSNVIHLTTRELCQLAAAIHGRLQVVPGHEPMTAHLPPDLTAERDI